MVTEISKPWIALGWVWYRRCRKNKKKLGGESDVAQKGSTGEKWRGRNGDMYREKDVVVFRRVRTWFG